MLDSDSKWEKEISIWYVANSNNNNNTFQVMNFQKVILFVITVTIIAACSKTPYLPYHSTADIPTMTTKTKTEMKQAKLEGVRTNYAVIAAVDDDSLGYLLFAPGKVSSTTGNSIPENFWDYNITLSTAIPPKDVEELVKVTEVIIDQWENLNQSNDGFFYEYSQTLEQDIKRVSENVISYRPAVHIYFNITEKGSTGRLIMGEEQSSRSFEIDSRSDLVTFRELLLEGQRLLQEL